METRKSYGQYCGLARALDRVGDRWTLLVVRELLGGPRTFRQLEGALAGVSPSLLTARLAWLVDDGLAVRADAPARSKAVTYSLTPAGRALEPVVLALIRFGSRWMDGGPGGDRYEPSWAPLALRALLGGTPGPSGTRVHVDVSGTWVTIATDGGGRTVVAGRDGAADATVTVTLPVALAVASGRMRLRDADALVTGSRRAAAAMLGPPRPARATESRSVRPRA